MMRTVQCAAIRQAAAVWCLLHPKLERGEDDPMRQSNRGPRDGTRPVLSSSTSSRCRLPKLALTGESFNYNAIATIFDQ